MTTLAKRRDDRGWGLIPTLAVITVLTLLGMTVLQATGAEVVGSARRPKGDRALNIAEAGVSYGFNALQGPPYNFGFSHPNFNTALNETNAPLVTSEDPEYPLLGWHEITEGGIGPYGPHAFGGGSFRVAVHDDYRPDGGGVPQQDDNGVILLRSLGIDSSGVQRLIEVSITRQ